MPLEITVNAQLTCDFSGGRLLVAGDHHRPNACLTTGGDGGFGLLSERVAHSDQPDKDQVFGEIPFVVALRQLAVGQRENPQRGPRQLLVRLFPPSAILWNEGCHPRHFNLSAAGRKHHPR